MRLEDNTSTSMDYQAFLAGKRVEAAPVGFSVPISALNPTLFTWQAEVVRWALACGRAALFEAMGLGKTAQQIEWAYQVHQHTGRDVLILTPLAVASQTVREGAKFGRVVTACRSHVDVQPGINVTNYEMLEHFDASHFVGIVLDESSILKSFMGVTKRRLVDAFAATPYRLCCTATPAPNDHLELGNHAEFLGVMSSNEMIMRWFINDPSSAGTFRLKGHAAADFWRWVASWAVSLRQPSDLGYPNDGYDLPPLRLHQHTVEVDLVGDRGDHLFRLPDLNATGIHAEMRRTAPARADLAANLVNNSSGAWAVWCNTNYEADELMARIHEAIEVRGSQSIGEKERALAAFADGSARVIVTKPSVAGFGLNWQHCHQSAVAGLNYSFESLHQLIGRFHRFGQREAVDVHIIAASTEGAIVSTIERKRAAYADMMNSLVAAMAREGLAGAARRTLTTYDPHTPMVTPAWLRSAL